MEALFSQLYPFVFLIGLAGFGPQIYQLMRNPASADSLSLSTWAIWALTWFISLGYGVTKLHDFMFCLTASVNFSAHMAIFLIIAYRRLHHMMAFQSLRPAYLRMRK